MESVPGSTAERLNFALRRLNTELTSSNRAVAAVTGLNESDLAVLDLLHQEGPTAPAVLSRRTRIHPATLTNVLARLERDGWIERRPVATDRRSIQIHPIGTSRLTAVYAPANARLAALLDSFPAGQADAVLTFLEAAADVVHDAADDLAGRATTPKTQEDPR